MIDADTKRYSLAELSGSSGKSGCFRWESDPGLASRLVPAAVAPDEGMPVRVPVRGRPRHGPGDLVPALEPAPLERQRAQHLPPGLDQVEVGGVGGPEDHLPARVGEHKQED